jgi:hypothetical protein
VGRKRCLIITVGDLNGRVRWRNDDLVEGNFSKRTTNDNGEI